MIRLSALLVLLSLPWAQFPQSAPPDLAGTWVATTDAPQGFPAAPSAVMGARFAITQSGGALTLMRPVRDLVISSAFTPAGGEVRTTVPGNTCLGDASVFDTIAWEGEALVFTSVGSQPPGAAARVAANTRRVLRRTSPDTLTIEATMVQGGQPRQVASVYRRSADVMTPTPPKAIAATVPATIDAVTWMAGTWIAEAAANAPAGALTTEERWTPPAGGSMQGMARELRGSALASFEFLCAVERAGSLSYLAMPGARSPATEFVLTAIDPRSATFENPGHDYPKKIKYSLIADDSLQTEVSGAAGSRTTTVTLKRR